jgi:hypothetical protein
LIFTGTVHINKLFSKRASFSQPAHFQPQSLRGATLAILKSAGTQPVVRDEGSEDWEKVFRDGLEKGGGDGVELAGCWADWTSLVVDGRTGPH